MGNDSSRLNDITDGMSGRIVRSVLPGIKTVRGAAYKERVVKDIRRNNAEARIARANARRMSSFTGGYVESGGSERWGSTELDENELCLPEVGTCNAGQVWLAIQNSMLSRTTNLVYEKGRDIIRRIDDQMEHDEGKLVIWGYGRSFPSDS
eukprot:15355389-Ditylum_brightwellii.AAC.1